MTTQSDSDRLTGLTDVITPWAIRAAVTLDLPDLVGDGPATVDDLARRTGTDGDALARLLRYLSCRGVFRFEPDGRVGGSDLSLLLRRDHPSGRRAWLDLDGMGGRNDRTAAHVLDAVRSGRPVYPDVYGRAYWDDLAADAELSRSFDALMATHSGWFDLVVDAVDWSRSGRVIDVGGGSGVLLSKILQAAPTLTGAVFDLPGPVATAPDTFAQAGVTDRASAVEGSFLETIPAGADTYVLSNVLHDWPDAVAEDILVRCSDAAGDDGRIIIAERLVDAADDRQTVTRMDLRMLLLVGGKERTHKDFQMLADSAGVIILSTRATPAGIWVFECARAIA